MKRIYQEQQRQRRRDLLNRYGESNCNRILEGKIWIGMTSEMAKESLGFPDDINRTVLTSSVLEQWVYEGEGANYYNTYLNFDDGILTNWQD